MRPVDAESGGVVFRFRSSGPPPADPAPLAAGAAVADRLRLAAEWALSLDAQQQRLVESGEQVRVVVPEARPVRPGRALRPTLAEYRRLRLGVGELVLPVLLDPPGLEALYPFQRDGVRWLLERDGAILADDMGLGKTVQVVTALRLLFNRGAIRTVVVVCPKGLLATWEREFSKWAPEIGVAVLTPPRSLREDAWRAVAGRRHVLLTNYEHLRTPPEVLKRNPPEVVVADEAHRLRRRGAKVTGGAAQLRPQRFWALSGTPLERAPDDLATLLALVAPTRFSPSDARLHPSSLRSRAREFVLRRRKREVLDQLPPVRDTTEHLALTAGQERAYRRALREPAPPGDELALLTRLLTICDFDPETKESSKLERILSQLDRVRGEGEKAVVFSHRLEPLHALRRRLTETCGEGAGLLLVGEMGAEERERALDRFRNDERAVALLASTRIGGEGLTLTEANHVFLFNQWWNPSTNDQARDRVVRIGQRRSVRVVRFCCRDTIEEGLERILERKRELFDDLVDRLATDADTALRMRILRELGAEALRRRDFAPSTEPDPA